jgi:hypothetical protein
VILDETWVLGHPGMVPNTIPFQQLVAVGLPAWLPGGAQTPAWRDLVGFSQAPKQEGWPVLTGLSLATTWMLGRAGHNHVSKHAPRTGSGPPHFDGKNYQVYQRRMVAFLHGKS